MIIVRAGNGSLELTHDPWPITFNVGNMSKWICKAHNVGCWPAESVDKHVDKHTTPKSIIRVIHVNNKCMSTAHFIDKYLVLCTLRNSDSSSCVFCVIRLRLPSLVQRVIHWYIAFCLYWMLKYHYPQTSVSIYCELLSMFYCDLLGWWNTGGSWVDNALTHDPSTHCLLWFTHTRTEPTSSQQFYNKFATSQCQSPTSGHIKMLGCGKFLSVGGVRWWCS